MTSKTAIWTIIDGPDFAGMAWSTVAMAELRTAARCRGTAGHKVAAVPRSDGRGRHRRPVPRRCDRSEMVFCAPMSDGLTMPAMVRMRSSALTRTSWVPLIIRLPLGSTSVTTAATDRSMFSERVVAPLPWLSVFDEMSPSMLALEPVPSTSNEPPSPSVRLAVRLRSDSFLSLARSLIEISTVRRSPASSARGSVNSLLWRSSHSENFLTGAAGFSG